MSPRELLHHEREPVLDMPSPSLDVLDDTHRVKLLRSERAVRDAERAVNTSLLGYTSTLANSAWAAMHSVAIEPKGALVAVAEFSLGLCRGGTTA